MKKRYGFVSNSSSSSFICIGNEINDTKDVIFSLSNGENGFGWGPETFNDIHSKLNWAFLIGNHIFNYENDYMIEFVKDVFENNNCTFEIYEDLQELIKEGYIDHQSVEQDNAIMWNSSEAMALWLFSNNSYIELDNDNY